MSDKLETEEVVEEVVDESKPTDDREEILEGIADDLKAVVPEEDVVEGKEEVEDSDIPDEFTSVALEANFTKDDIVEFAAGRSNEELLELIPSIQDAMKGDEEEEEEEKVDEEVKSGEKLSVEDAADVKALVQAGIKEEMAPVLKMLEDQKKVDKERSDEELGRRTNELFDKAGEEFSVFGKFSELPRFPSGKLKGQLVPNSPEVKARSEVFDDARIFMNAGLSTEVAMSKAIALYKGTHLETEVKRGVIKDLHRQSKRLSGARTAKTTKKVFTDDREEILDGIRQDMKAMGLE